MIHRLHLWTLSAFGVTPGKTPLPASVAGPKSDITRDGMAILVPICLAFAGVLIALVAV